MNRITDLFSASPRPTQAQAPVVTPVNPRPTFQTDRLGTRAPGTAPIGYDASVDGCSARQLMTELGATPRPAAKHPKPISEQELREQVAGLCDHAAAVSTDRELADLGDQAQALLERVNATPAGRLSGAARASAARAMVPLAQAGEFTALLSQADKMLRSGSREQKTHAAHFMRAHGTTIQGQIHALDVPGGMIAILDKQYTKVDILLEMVLRSIEEEGRREQANQKKWWQRHEAAIQADAADDRLRDQLGQALRHEDQAREAARTERRLDA